MQVINIVTYLCKYNNYLKRLSSLTRQPARFNSISTEIQLDVIRNVVRLLFDAVNKLIDICDKERLVEQITNIEDSMNIARHAEALQFVLFMK